MCGVQLLFLWITLTDWWCPVLLSRPLLARKKKKKEWLLSSSCQIAGKISFTEHSLRFLLKKPPQCAGWSWWCLSSWLCLQQATQWVRYIIHTKDVINSTEKNKPTESYNVFKRLGTIELSHYGCRCTVTGCLTGRIKMHEKNDLE